MKAPRQRRRAFRGLSWQVGETRETTPWRVGEGFSSLHPPLLRGNLRCTRSRNGASLWNYSAFAAEVTLIVSPSSAPSRTTLSPINDFTFSAPSNLNTFLSLS